MFERCYRMAGITERDRIQITPGYGLWTAGIGFQAGCERLGAMAVPMGPGNTDKQLRMMVDMRSTVLCATSSYALLLAEEIKKRGIRDQICLRKGVIGSERWGDKMRKRIADDLGVEFYDIYGLTEIYGPGIGISCDSARYPLWDVTVIRTSIPPEGPFRRYCRESSYDIRKEGALVGSGPRPTRLSQESVPAVPVPG